MPYESERHAAIESVLKGCRLCEAVRSHLFSNEAIGKEDGSPVTVADFGVQAVVSRHLAASFPNVPLVGEEDASLLRQGENALLKEEVVDHVKRITPDQRDHEILEAIDQGASEGGSKGRFWTLDPIDGTKGFLRGGQYAVALALVEEGEVVLGVLGCPNLPLDVRETDGRRGCLFVAVRGEGATMRGLSDAVEQRIEVTKIAHPSEARLCESFESSHSSHEHAARIAQILGLYPSPLRMDSQCKYAVVARGDAAIYLRLPTGQSYQETIWDHAAGSIIVQEAGGKVTDMAGRLLDFSLGRSLANNRGIVVTNGELHDLVLNAVQQVFP
jgi:3'(2'), 5'-bisphosphate nucleotidase